MGDADTRITRVVADADVLTADLLVGGPAREAMDIIRSHSWMNLYASEPLLADAEALIRQLGSDELASDWREKIAEILEMMDHPRGDHPGVAVAVHGDAGHILTFDEGLRSAAASVAIRQHTPTSIKTPAGFVRLFDPTTVYEAVFGEAYPGPDRDPRA